MEKATIAVVRISINIVALTDLNKNRRKIFTIVGAVDTSYVFIAILIWFTILINRDPVRMLNVELLIHTIGIHSRKHAEPVFSGSFHDLTEEISLSKERRTV